MHKINICSVAFLLGFFSFSLSFTALCKVPSVDPDTNGTYSMDIIDLCCAQELQNLSCSRTGEIVFILFLVSKEFTYSCFIH